MIHIVIFCYFITILIGVSAGTIQWIEFKTQVRGKYKPMSPFVAMLLVLNFFDLFIYYNDNILKNSDNAFILSVGNCLIALLVLIWLRLLMEEDEKANSIERKVRWYVITYVLIWIGSSVFLTGTPWVRLIIDLPMMVILVAGSISFIKIGRKNGDNNDLTTYKVVVVFFMVLIYLSYFISESTIIPTYDPRLMNTTVLYWLAINVANLWILYKEYFCGDVEEAPIHMKSLEEAMQAVKSQYNLTTREAEILAEIYRGKTNTQIGKTLYISESTVKAHVYSTFRKLGVNNRGGAVCIVREEHEKEV